MKGSDILNKLAIACNPANYGGIRRQKVKYIVVHYTAGDGDTARDNGWYFQRNAGLGASAHWFVDGEEAVDSVPEEYVAWHCGGETYIHPECRNGNSIGVELCSNRDADGTYYFSDGTLENAAALIRELMKKYDIKIGNVLRHYDVTGKKCPASMTEAGRWEEFRSMIIRYQSAEDVPEWAQETVRKLMERQILRGDGQGLDLSRDMVRMLVLLDRAGTFG